MPTQDLTDQRSAGIPWHALPLAGVLERLGVSDGGLSAGEARERLARTGPNALVVAPAVSAWRILRRQFEGVVVLLLVIAGLVAAAGSDVPVAAAIGLVLVLNVAIGFGTELRARRATDALRRLDVPRATALRSGRAVALDAHELVPGDLILLEAGQAVPADARLVQATGLRTAEALLSGESLPVEKLADDALGADTVLPERRNMVFRATTVVAGAARAVVVGTGMATEIGRIGALVSSVPDERTPIERRLDALGRRLAIGAIGVGVLVGGFEGWRHADLRLLVQTALAVAVAAVPEGLPAVVTIAMAVGVWRMSRRGVLVRRLPAVESLGSATVICVDKTGTLTAGVQTVTTFWLPPREIRVTGTAYEPAGTFFEGETPLVAADDPALAQALRTGALANRAGIEREGDVLSARGDPTDIALLVAARKAGFERAALVAHLPEVGEHPFSSERMLMATFHSPGDGTIRVHVKGAPGPLYALCDRVLAAGREEPATAEWERRVADRSAALGARGLRVLGLAAGSAAGASLDSLRGLTFLGLVGMTDPPAPGVRQTIARLRGAGIRTVMLTGDQQATAQAVATELGVAEVVSRITPEGKLRAVSEMRDAGHIVAMLGDGVNDAPALRRADIGVAMGTRGTDVAKEAAGIILRDDRLETVVAAVEEGRVVYDNIRRFVFYLFSCNLAEIVALLGAGALGMPLPMTPLQILFLNLVTDTIPALALALEPAGRGIMTRPPRDPRAAILSGGLLRLTFLYAALIATITLLSLAWGLRTGSGDPMRAVTLSFTTLALAQLFHLGNARSEEHVLSPRRMFANRYAVGAIVLSLAAQVAAVTLPGLSRVLGTRELSAGDWLVALALALVPAVAGQLWKAIAPPRRDGADGPAHGRTRDPSTTRSPG